MNEDLVTAKQITHMLDKAAGNLSPAIEARLQASISMACEAHRQKTEEAKLNQAPSLGDRLVGWFNAPRIAVAFSCAMLAVVTFGITTELDEVKVAKVEALAELDAAILMDDLPTEAYLDSDFIGFTSQQPQRPDASEDMERWLEQVGNQSS